jgi:GNAT superfamily N-acetyltransferase
MNANVNENHSYDATGLPARHPAPGQRLAISPEIRRTAPRHAMMFELFTPASEELMAIASVWHASWCSTGLADAGDDTQDALFQRLCAAAASSEWTLCAAGTPAAIAGFVALNQEQSWLRQLFVAPQAQYQGVGSLLLAHAKDKMKDGFWLRCDPGNLKARRFYERHQFRLDAIAPHPRHGRTMATYIWP